MGTSQCSGARYEVWKPWRSGVYEVSDCGRIRRAQQGKHGIRTTGQTWIGRLLAQFRDQDGYYKCTLRSEQVGSRYCFFVHRVVAEAFHGPCPAGKQVNHKDGWKVNNHPTNLEYVTTHENLAHAARTGLKARGEKNRHAKLNTAQVLEIRAYWQRKAFDQPTLGRMYGVGQTQISAIVRGRSWTHV